MNIKPIAFYLPQFHPVEENSLWWGTGFTEWTNVAKAKPNFDGHYQPHIPKDLGFYDLRLTEIMKEQVELAKKYSIYGFCFYYYWFSGKRILSLPIDNFVNNEIDFPFCFCWANENWTKRWDGGNNEILLQNEHSVENDNKFIEDIFPYMKKNNYIMYDEKPVILIYRPDILCNSKKTFEHWRKRAVEEGFKGLFICSVAFYNIDDTIKWGVDALVEFPPHKYLTNAWVSHLPNIKNPNFSGYFLDYRSVLSQSVSKKHDDFLYFYGAMPSWDNTARRQNDPHTFINSSPELFEYWIRMQSLKTLKNAKNKEKFIFINAWNEWAEGAHLEPCLKYGHAHLNAVKRGVQVQKYLSPQIPMNTTIGALSSISSYDSDDFKYFSELEYNLLLSFNDLQQNRENIHIKYSTPASLPSLIANKVRDKKTLYKILRFFYRTMRKVAK